jgi:hypothetical protein
MVEKVAGAVVGNVVGKVFGGGERAPTSQLQTIPGVEFQPFTYKGATGGVTGTPSGDGYGYEWSADVAPWLTELGGIGSGAAGGLFKDYLTQVGMDPYAASQEYYKRGLAQLEPEIAKQRTALGGSLFGSGRLGLKLAGEGLGYGSGAGQVNPDIAGFGAGVGKAYTDLYANALTQGQQLQTNRLNQLSQAAESMLALGMKPAEVEQNLIKFASNLETARSNALKAGTQNVNLAETPQSVFAGQLANTVGTAVSDYFNPPSTGLSDPYYTFNYGSNFGANAPMATVNTGTGMFSSGGGYYNELGNYGSFAPNAFTFGG